MIILPKIFILSFVNGVPRAMVENVKNIKKLLKTTSIFFL